MAGIENANYKQALDIIHAQMKEMKQGNFSDEELAQTKAVVKNQLLETIDVSRGLVEILYHNVISGRIYHSTSGLQKQSGRQRKKSLQLVKRSSLIRFIS